MPPGMRKPQRRDREPQAVHLAVVGNLGGDIWGTRYPCAVRIQYLEGQVMSAGAGPSDDDKAERQGRRQSRRGAMIWASGAIP